MKKTIVELFIEYVSENMEGTKLEKEVLNILKGQLLEVETFEELQTELEEGQNCSIGCVGALIYYNQTDNFFKNNTDDILELLNENISSCGYPNFELNTNNLSWFAYEETCYKFATMLEDFSLTLPEYIV